MLSKLKIASKLTSKSFSTKASYLHNIGKEPLINATVGQILENAAQKFGDKPAVISCKQNKTLSFIQALQKADKLSATFRTLGLQKGDRIGIWAPNCLEWYITKMACARSGFILVALNPFYQALEIEYCVNKVGIKAMVCGHLFKKQNYYEILNSIDDNISKNKRSLKMPTLEHIIIVSPENLEGTHNFHELLGKISLSEVQKVQKTHHEIQSDDPCNLQFTSGTTGKPKAALVSHFNLVNNSYNIGIRNEQNQKDHTICVQVPLFHAFGTSISTMPALHFGSTMVLPSNGYDPDASLSAIRDQRCTIIHGTPTMYVDLIHRQTERQENISPEIAVTGGAPCPPTLFKQMLEILNVKKVKSVFGLTETTAVIFQSMPDDDMQKSTETVGHLGQHIEAKVIDERNKIVPCGTPGELCVRGYMNMLGYWGDVEKTNETIGPDRWLRTGDQFILTEDGYGKIVGRFKEMIIRGGENIYPKEIEDFLMTHEDILECHIIGLPHERLGEEVAACLRLKNGNQLTKEDIVNFCRGKIANFKIPTKVKIVDSFPKTTSGKIQKFKLIQMYSK